MTNSGEQEGEWKKSSFSAAAGECVELATATDDMVAMRDSKNPDGGVLVFTRREFDAFVKGILAGEFDSYR